MLPGFNLHSAATTATSSEEASGDAQRAEGSSAAARTSGEKGTEALKMLQQKDQEKQQEIQRRQEESKRRELLARLVQVHGKSRAEAVLAHQSALRADVQERGEPSSAGAPEEDFALRVGYSPERLSASDPGRHFLHRLNELEALFKREPHPSRKEIQRKCEDLTECAEVFAGKLGMSLKDVSASVLKENGLDGKDPETFTLTDDEYKAVCQKVQALHESWIAYWDRIEASYFTAMY